MNLTDKVIAITGAGGGLGEATAILLSKQGCNLALIDLDTDSLNATFAACKEAGAAATTIHVANVADEHSVIDLFASITDQFGALHGLINNAGITRDGFTVKVADGKVASKMPLQQWQAVVDVNLTGVFLCGREAAAAMINTNSTGCIVNISSISRAGNMGQINYSATKAGVEAMAVVWSKELARYGIRAASIAPGFIGTEMVMAMKPEAREKMTKPIPAGRIGEPDEIASTVQFILENEYVNGRCFEIDGGLRI